MYTDESFRIKTTRKYGKCERRIVKDHRTQLDVKEREGYKTPVVNPYVVPPFFFVGLLTMVYLEAHLERSMDSLWVRDT